MARDLYSDSKLSHEALGDLEANLSYNDIELLLETENDIVSILNRCTNSIPYAEEELVEFIKQVRINGI